LRFRLEVGSEEDVTIIAALCMTLMIEALDCY